MKIHENCEMVLGDMLINWQLILEPTIGDEICIEVPWKRGYPEIIKGKTKSTIDSISITCDTKQDI